MGKASPNGLCQEAASQLGLFPGSLTLHTHTDTHTHTHTHREREREVPTVKLIKFGQVRKIKMNQEKQNPSLSHRQTQRTIFNLFALLNLGG